MAKVEIEKGHILSPFKHTQVCGIFELTPFKKQRTSPQNRYLHGGLFPEFAKILSKKFGKNITMKMAKGVLKAECGKDYIPLLGVWTITPTSEMNTARMVRFIDDCLKYVAIKCGEYLETPEEYLKRKFDEE